MKRVIVPTRQARIHRMAELIPWNVFLGPLKVKNGLSTAFVRPWGKIIKLG
jgi:hypothetical protein